MQITKIIEIIWELWNGLTHLDLTFPGNGPWKITHGPGSRSGPVSRSLGPGSRCGAGRGGVGASSAGHQGRTHCSAAGKSTEIDGENDSFHRFSGNRQKSVVFWHPLALRCREKNASVRGNSPRTICALWDQNTFRAYSSTPPPTPTQLQSTARQEFPWSEE